MSLLATLNLKGTDILQVIKSHPLQTELKKTEDEYIVKRRPVDFGVIKLPKVFDGRKKWGRYLTPVQNQGTCGSCWAFSSTSALSDRFNIQSFGRMNVFLSPAVLILCGFQETKEAQEILHPEENLNEYNKINEQGVTVSACHGNTLFNAYKYLYLYGSALVSCIPYDLSRNPNNFASISESADPVIPLCASVTGPINDMCQDFVFNPISGEEQGTPMRSYRAKHFYGVENNIDYIKHEIYRWGPVSAGFRVYTNFYTFNPKLETYEWDKQEPQVGGHAVVIVGWTEDSWIIRNTWGEKWGDNGYFYMKFNQCGLEDNIIAAVPDFFYSVDQDVEANNWAEKDEDVKERTRFDTDLSYQGGGIDPTNGYSRRVLDTKPWVKKTRPIDFKLDYLNSLVAGEMEIPVHYDFMVILVLLIGAALTLFLDRKARSG